MKIEFNEEKKIITLETPAGNSIVINENGKSVEIKDQSQNSIRLSSDGITMNSIKDINISAKGSIRHRRRFECEYYCQGQCSNEWVKCKCYSQRRFYSKSKCNRRVIRFGYNYGERVIGFD